MQEEYDALMANNTWTFTSLPPDRNSIECKWILRVKEIVDETINKYKAHLVAKGFHQKYGCDYTKTFSPVVKHVTVHIILTLAFTNQRSLQKIDVNNAFLNKKRFTWILHLTFFPLIPVSCANSKNQFMV